MTLADQLRTRREAAGLSLNEVSFRLRDHLPAWAWVTGETIRAYETGKTLPGKANTVVLAALATVYGCKLTDLLPDVADDAKRVSDLLVNALRCSTRTAHDSLQKVLAAAS